MSSTGAMPTSRRGRESFVVYATEGARGQALRLGLEGVLENAVRDAILDGRLRFHPFAGMQPLREGERLVLLDGLVVRTVKREATASGRRRLLITWVERAPQNVNHHNTDGRRRRS